MKKYKKNFLFILGILVILIVILFYYSSNVNLTGKTIQTENESNFTHSWTKAICNETHCQDYEVICKGNELVSMSPITGMVAHSEDWEDSRDEEMQNRICEKAYNN